MIKEKIRQAKISIKSKLPPNIDPYTEEMLYRLDKEVNFYLERFTNKISYVSKNGILYEVQPSEKGLIAVPILYLSYFLWKKQLKEII